MAARAHLGNGVGTSGTGQLRAAQTGARSPPPTKPIPAIAASGLATNASPMRPSSSASAACVVPQVGPLSFLNAGLLKFTALQGDTDLVELLGVPGLNLSGGIHTWKLYHAKGK